MANAPQIQIDTIAFEGNKSYILTSRTGWEVTPGLSGSNIAVPGRNGEIWRAKDYAPGRMVLDIVVTHLNSSGVVPGGSTAEKQYQANMDLLMVTLTQQTQILVTKVYDPDGLYPVTRQNYAEVTALLQPEFIGSESEPSATLTVELTFPNPIWFDLIGRDYVGAANATNNRTLTLTRFEGITAPLDEAIFLVIGPATNPRITDRSGAWVQYNGTIAAGARWRVNTRTFQSEVGSSPVLFYTENTVTNQNAGTSVLAQTTFSPGPALMTVTPNGIGSPELVFTGTGLGSTTQVNVCAFRKYIS